MGWRLHVASHGGYNPEITERVVFNTSKNRFLDEKPAVLRDYYGLTRKVILSYHPVSCCKQRTSWAKLINDITITRSYNLK